MEWPVLRQIARGIHTADEERVLSKTLRGEFAWARLLELATLHHLLAPLAYWVLRVDEGVAPRWVRYIFQDAVALNTVRIRCYQRALADIVNGLNLVGIPFLATKGIVFYSTYREGCRQASYDLDLMIHPRDREAMMKALTELGLTQGYYHPESGTVRQHGRREHILYTMNPDHLVRFGLITGDPSLPCVSVDVANSLTWTNSEYSVPIEGAFANRQFFSIAAGRGEVLVPCMHPVPRLVHTALHLFREAWLESSAYEINLRKFSDVLHVWRILKERGESAQLAAYLVEHRICEPVCWVLHHMDRTLGENACETLGFERSLSSSFLCGAYGRGGRMLYWHGDMLRRLFAYGDRLELSEALPQS